MLNIFYIFGNLKDGYEQKYELNKSTQSKLADIRCNLTRF